MAFEISRNRDVCREIRRIAREEIDRAAAALDRAGEGRFKGVHDARKRFKAIRALLRLAEPPLGRFFRRENRWYRDAARKLAPIREAQANLETLDRLENAGDAGLRREFEARYQAMRERRLHGPDGLASLAEDLARARKRVADWPLAGKGFEVIAPGLRATYRRGRGGFRRASRGASATELHEWRKDVKHHRHQLELLVRLWPDVMKGAVATARALGDLLGDHHDLHELGTQISHSPTSAASGDGRDAALAAARSRARELEARALAIGGLLYAEKPGRFLARMEAYWDAHSGDRAR